MFLKVIKLFIKQYFRIFWKIIRKSYLNGLIMDAFLVFQWWLVCFFFLLFFLFLFVFPFSIHSHKDVIQNIIDGPNETNKFGDSMALFQSALVLPKQKGIENCSNLKIYLLFLLKLIIRIFLWNTRSKFKELWDIIFAYSIRQTTRLFGRKKRSRSLPALSR